MNRCLTFAVLLALSTSGLSENAFGAADDWITINKNYFGQRYVDLDQITPQNVGNLKEVCEIQLNENSLFSTGLLKVGRTLYVTLSRLTYAIDAATCDLLWLHGINYQTTPITSNNRGSAYLDGAIFRGTPDGYVIALDANTGEPLPTWPENGVLAADVGKNETFVSAPIAWQGKVFIGIGISDNGIAGRLMAFDAKTGNQLWSFQTTLPGPTGAPANAGGGLWSTYSLDPKTGEVFAGVANPYPDFNRDTDNPPGSIAFTNSVISVDAGSGRPFRTTNMTGISLRPRPCTTHPRRRGRRTCWRSPARAVLCMGSTGPPEYRSSIPRAQPLKITKFR